MSGLNIIPNDTLGEWAHLASLPETADSLIVVPLEATGLETDEVLRDKDNLSDLLSGTTNEQTTAGRKTLTNVTVTTDDTLNRKVLDCDNPSWSGAESAGNTVAKAAVCYKPDTGSADTAIRLMGIYDADWIPDGATFTLNIADLIRATSGE